MKAGRHLGVCYAKLDEGWTVVNETNVQVDGVPYFKHKYEVINYIKNTAKGCSKCGVVNPRNGLHGGMCQKCGRGTRKERRHQRVTGPQYANWIINSMADEEETHEE